MLIVRELPAAEWDRLTDTPLAGAMPAWKTDAHVLVAERDGAIIAHWGLFSLTHADGCWIAPDERGNAGLFRQLIDGMRQMAVRHDRPLVVASPDTPGVGDMLTRLGAVPIPWPQPYVWAVKG